MKKTSLILLIVLCCGISLNPLSADDISDLKKQLQAMQAQMQQLQAKIEAQEQILQQQKVIMEQEIVADVQENNKNKQAMTISGLVEVTAIHSNSDGWGKANVNDINLATLALDISAPIGSWATANINFFYEDNDTDILPIDQAFLEFSNPEQSPLFFTIGRTYVPFGNLSSNMVSYPITFTLADTREDIALAGLSFDNGLHTSIYTFSDDVAKMGKNHEMNFGADLAYVDDNFDLGVAYISNMGTSTTLQDLIASNPQGYIQKYIPGVRIHAIANMEPFSLIAEYISALDPFAAYELTQVTDKTLKPRAYNIELAYNFTLAGKEATFALGYQGSKDMYFDLATTDLFEKAWLASLAFNLNENTSLSMEWRRANAYQLVKSGLNNAYKAEDLFQLLLSYEF